MRYRSIEIPGGLVRGIAYAPKYSSFNFRTLSDAHMNTDTFFIGCPVQIACGLESGNLDPVRGTNVQSILH